MHSNLPEVYELNAWANTHPIQVPASTRPTVVMANLNPGQGAKNCCYFHIEYVSPTTSKFAIIEPNLAATFVASLPAEHCDVDAGWRARIHDVTRHHIDGIRNAWKSNSLNGYIMKDMINDSIIHT